MLNHPLKSEWILSKGFSVRIPTVGGAECWNFCLLYLSQLKSFGTGKGGESLYMSRIMMGCPCDSCFSLYMEPYETDNALSLVTTTFYNPSSYLALMNSCLSFL